MFEPQPAGSKTFYKRKYMHMQLPAVQSTPQLWNDWILSPYMWHFDLVVWRDRYPIFFSYLFSFFFFFIVLSIVNILITNEIRADLGRTKNKRTLATILGVHGTIQIGSCTMRIERLGQCVT